MAAGACGALCGALLLNALTQRGANTTERLLLDGGVTALVTLGCALLLQPPLRREVQGLLRRFGRAFV